MIDRRGASHRTTISLSRWRLAVLRAHGDPRLLDEDLKASFGGCRLSVELDWLVAVRGEEDVEGGEDEMDGCTEYSSECVQSEWYNDEVWKEGMRGGYIPSLPERERCVCPFHRLIVSGNELNIFDSVSSPSPPPLSR